MFSKYRSLIPRNETQLNDAVGRGLAIENIGYVFSRNEQVRFLSLKETVNEQYQRNIAQQAIYTAAMAVTDIAGVQDDRPVSRYVSP